MRVSYRLKQGLRDILAFRQSVNHGRVAEVLSPAQLSLFSRMTHSEQLHSQNVLDTVLAQDADTPHDLKVAALLHDVGKSRYALSVAERSLAVAIRRIYPAGDMRWSSTERLDRWHAPFVVRQHHPRWGAEMLRMTGGTQRAVWLIEHHADPLSQWANHPYEPLLRRLKDADDAN